MESQTQKIEQLQNKIDALEKEHFMLLDAKKTIAFLCSVYKQKIEHLEKHYPTLVRNAEWDLKTSHKEQDFQSISLYDLKILN